MSQSEQLFQQIPDAHLSLELVRISQGKITQFRYALQLTFRDLRTVTAFQYLSGSKLIQPRPTLGHQWVIAR